MTKLVTVQLNKGLDLVSPHLLVEPGSLMDCLNYEMTDISGYRRIDGYERYDGYPDGDLSKYYRYTITATVGAEQSLIIPGAILQRVGDAVVEVGVVVGGPITATTYDVIAVGAVSSLSVNEDYLLLQNGINNILLQTSGGLLRLQATGSLGGTFRIKTPSGALVAVTVSGSPIEGSTLVPFATYLANLRQYSGVLRGQVTLAPGILAGMYWFEDRLLAAIDTTRMTLSTTGTPPREGVRLRWAGVIYRLVAIDLVDTNLYHLFLSRTGLTSGTVNDSLVEVTVADAVVTTWITAVGGGNAITAATSFASLGFFNNPATSLTRGFTYLPVGYSSPYTSGKTVSGVKPAITQQVGATASDSYFIVGDAGASVIRTRLTQITQATGSFGTPATGAGAMQLVTVSVTLGARDYPKINDEVHSAYPTTGTSRVFIISAIPTTSRLAGSAALNVAGTRYVWDTYNFYGQRTTLSAFSATGASKGFWASEYGYGTVDTGLNIALDVPKYLARHNNKLVLGYAHGSATLSVAGEPYNFQGIDGAIDLATGDNVTGLVELPGATLAVFGKKAIRKITGFTTSDTALGTIAGSSSCFDYTAILVGQEAIYTGLQGISTLQQSASYGDFTGKRLSELISPWLRPRLVGNAANVEQGGIAFAYPVRSKQQYRLVLLTGEVVIVTFTDKGPTLTFMNHSLIGNVRVPYCLSSSIGRDGQEKLHASWKQEGLRKQAIAIDRGWGFDGQYFNHFFETSHVFTEGGEHFSGVERVRMYGQGYGLASLNVKSSGIENDFDQAYHNTIQDISMPATPTKLYDRLQPVMAIVDQANWGLGIKLKIQNTTGEGSTATEPSHICQVLLLRMRTEGANDS